MGQAKRELERHAELTMDIVDVALSTGALERDENTDELICAEDDDAERHAYARATILQKRGQLSGTRLEICEALWSVLAVSR